MSSIKFLFENGAITFLPITVLLLYKPQQEYENLATKVLIVNYRNESIEVFVTLNFIPQLFLSLGM